VAISLACCSPLLFRPTQQDVDMASKKWAGTTQEQLDHGYSLYIAKCGGCHYLHKPAEYTEERWMKIMPDMKTEAKLDSAQYDLIVRYVVTKSYTMATPN
jgi:hypothetical protein